MPTSLLSPRKVAPLTRDQAAAILSRHQTDPVAFVREVLGHDPWSAPEAILRALATERAQVAVKSCHSSGKTYSAAEAVLWWVFAMRGIAVTTAPTWTQVARLLWGELRRAHASARYALGGTLLQTELKVGPSCYALGLSTNEGVRFQGFHGRVLIVLDEAPGVRPDIWQAIQGIRAGGDVRILALGNPTISSGPFYDAFTVARAHWRTFTVDAFATPNLQGLNVEDIRRMAPTDLARTVRPYLATRQWVRERLDEDGESSPNWQARVRGQFPLQSDESLLSLSWLDAARYAEAPESGDWWAGLDVAGPGDSETVLCLRRGGHVVSLQAWPGEDPRGEVVAALAPYRQHGVRVNVDTIGQGYYMARHLQDQGLMVHDINVGEPARDREKYANSKAEHYWGLRLRFQQGDVSGLEDERTIAQLSSIRYAHNSRGQIAIESKDEARKRGVRSPDRAEAVMLCFALPPVSGVVVGGAHRTQATTRQRGARDEMDPFSVLRSR